MGFFLDDSIGDSVSAAAPVDAAVPEASQVPDLSGGKFFLDEPKPLSFLENVAGGTEKLLNSLTFNLGDEATSAVNAVIDDPLGTARSVVGEGDPFGALKAILGSGDGTFGQNYDARLNQIRSIDKRYSEANPISSLALGLGGFLTPVPTGIFSQAKGLAPALGNVAKAVGIGGVYGAGYGFGAGEGGAGNRAADAGIGALIGAAIGAPLQGLVEGAQGIGRGFSGIKNFLSPNLDAQASEIATDTVSQYTDPAKLVAKLKNLAAPDAFSSQMTTAERVRDPGLGLLTKVLENKIPEVGITKEALDTQRALNRNAIFTDKQGVLYSPENTGAKLQAALSEGSDALGAKVNEAYSKAYEGEGTAPIFPAKRAISRALDTQAQTGIAVDANTQSVIDNFRALPNNVSMEQLQGQRQLIGQLLGDIRSKGGNASVEEKAGGRVLAQLFGHIDDAEKFALTPEAQGVTADGTKKGFSGRQGRAVEKARALAASRGELFKSGAVNQITQLDRYGNFKMLASDVPATAISSPEEGRQIVAALKIKTPQGSGPDAQKSVAADLMETLRARSENPVSGRFEASRYARNWDKIEPVANEILSPAQIKVITKVRNDLVGEANFKASVGNASKGQSVTSQNLGAAAFVKSSISQAARNKVGILGKLFGAIGEGRQAIIESKVDEILTKISFDPKFTEMFLSPPTPKVVAQLKRTVLQRLFADIAPNWLPSGHDTELLQLAGLGDSELTSQLQSQSEGKASEIAAPAAARPRISTGTSGKAKSSSSALSSLLDSVLSPSVAQAEEFNPRGSKNMGVIEDIKADPYYHATALTESGLDPNAKNPNSSAAGLFQLTSSTAKALGVKNVFNAQQNFDGFKKLTEENKARFGNDPETLYAAHFLGASLLAKLQRGDSLTDTEKAQVQEFLHVALPHWQKNYERVLATTA
jgi:hypothetical protein